MNAEGRSMEPQGSKRGRIAMLTEEEVLPVLRRKWPDPMTANEIFFAVRPDLQGAEPRSAAPPTRDRRSTLSLTRAISARQVGAVAPIGSASRTSR